MTHDSSSTFPLAFYTCLCKTTCFVAASVDTLFYFMLLSLLLLLLLPFSDLNLFSCKQEKHLDEGRNNSVQNIEWSQMGSKR